MGPTALFGTIHGSYRTISANFYFYLQYFQQKVFSFSKISKSQTDQLGFLNSISINYTYTISISLNLITNTQISGFMQILRRPTDEVKNVISSGTSRLCKVKSKLPFFQRLNVPSNQLITSKGTGKLHMMFSKLGNYTLNRIKSSHKCL